MSSEVWILVALGRKENALHVLANIRRQETSSRVCVVENGEAEGVCASIGYTPDLLLTGPQHHSGARNVGLKEIRKRDGYFVVMDDDDYYGAQYVSEHLSLQARGLLVGKRVHWVHWEGEGLMLYGEGRANKASPWLRGGTISGYASEVDDFPIMNLGEDAALCQKFLRNGGKVWNSSVNHCAYMRRKKLTSHAYTPSRGAFDAENGPITRKGSWSDVDAGRLLGKTP